MTPARPFAARARHKSFIAHVHAVFCWGYSGLCVCSCNCVADGPLHQLLVRTAVTCQPPAEASPLLLLRGMQQAQSCCYSCCCWICSLLERWLSACMHMLCPQLEVLNMLEKNDPNCTRCAANRGTWLQHTADWVHTQPAVHNSSSSTPQQQQESMSQIDSHSKGPVISRIAW